MTIKDLAARPMAPLAVPLAALLTVPMAVLTGCSGDGDVATLATGGPTSPPAATAAAPGGGATAPVSDDDALLQDQIASADRFRACLAEAGIETYDTPVTMAGWEVEFVEVDPAPTDPKRYAYSIPGGSGGAGELFDLDTVIARIEAGEWVFVDGDVDRSETLSRCADESGYFIPAPRIDPREEETVKRQLAEASNEWAACARANGYPQLADAKVEVDNWQTEPAVELPNSMTVADLESLLQACPYVNPAVLGKTAEQLAALDPPPADPLVKFDLPADDPRAAALEETLRTSRINNTPEH